MTKIEVTKLEEFTGHQGPIYALCNAQHLDTFFSGGNDGFVGHWQTGNTTKGKLLIKIGKPIYAMLYIAQYNYLVVGTNLGSMHVFDLNNMAELKHIEAHKGAIFDLQITVENMISAGADGNVKVWRISDFTLIANLAFSTKSARCIAINTHKSEMAIGYSDTCIRVFSLTNYSLVYTLNQHTNSVFSVTYTQNGKMLLSGGRDVMLKSWIANNHYLINHNIPAHTLHINQLSFNQNGNWLASVSMDKTIKIWDAENLQLLKVINFEKHGAHLTSINKLVWLNNNTFVTASDDKKIMQWKLTIQ